MNKWNVIEVQPKEDFSLLLTFYNGKKRILDFEPFLDEFGIDKLKDVNFFMKAKVDHHTVMWDEQIDIAPEFLYEKSKTLKKKNIWSKLFSRVIFRNHS